MRAFLTFLTAILLLMPQGFGAMAGVLEDCTFLASSGVQPSCCCDHGGPEEDRGPYLAKDCCCEVEVPVAPSEVPSQPRVSPSSGDELEVQPAAALLKAPIFPRIPALAEVLRETPPRAPPGSLQVRLQSFLL